MAARWRLRKSAEPGRLVPPSAARLRSRAMRLSPNAEVAWHSTGEREELLIGLAGEVQIERRRSGRVTGRLRLRAGETLFIPQRVEHRVVNRSRRSARYIYVTG